MIVELRTDRMGPVLGRMRGGSSRIYFMLRSSVWIPGAEEGQRAVVGTIEDFNGKHLASLLVR